MEDNEQKRPARRRRPRASATTAAGGGVTPPPAERLETAPAQEPRDASRQVAATTGAGGDDRASAPVASDAGPRARSRRRSSRRPSAAGTAELTETPPPTDAPPGPAAADVDAGAATKPRRRSRRKAAVAAATVAAETPTAEARATRRRAAPAGREPGDGSGAPPLTSTAERPAIASTTRAPESVQAVDAAAARPKPRRRGRRGGARRSAKASPEAAPSAAGEIAAGVEAGNAQPAAEAAEEGSTVRKPTARRAARTVRAADEAAAGEGAVRPAADEVTSTDQPAAEHDGLDVASTDAAPGGDATAKRRRRGRRGGRRHKRRGDAAAADGGATQTAEGDATGRPAGPSAESPEEPVTSAARTASLVHAAVFGDAAAPATPAGDDERAGQATASDDGEAGGGPARPKRSRRRRKAAPAGEGGDKQADDASEGPADADPRQRAGKASKAPGRAAKEAPGETPEGGDGARKPRARTTRATDEKGERDKPRRSSRRGRRALAPVGNAEADLPGYKEILIASDAAELRVALVEDGRLAEIYIERPGRRSFAGNIYRGKVENVLPGIDAAFVDIGIDRNGFLAVDDVAVPEGGKRSRRIGEMLKPGQEVLVQVNKDPMGSKGARLTGQISIAGRYLVYVPGGSGVGVSRRLSTEERDRLRDACKSLKAKDAGLIVRTVAEGKDVDELSRDLKFLSRLWTRIKTKADKVKAPAIVHEEDDVALQVARDLFNDSFASVLVDDVKRRDKLVAYLDKTAPELSARVKLYDGAEPLFRAHGIEEQIARALERRVPLPSGGNLVIDHTEALTVIDVNSGKFTSGKGLEDTITRTNLEAAREVVRQLRLRDIGGIIIIDFIDMEHPKNREAVLGKLQAELDTDRTKTYVVEISPLGLVEMTRQNITDGARGILTQSCPACEGRARVLSNETMALTVERRLRRHVTETTAAAMLVEVAAPVAERMAAGGRSKRLEKETGRRFFFEGSRSLPVDTYRIIAEGTLAAVKSHRVPLKEDQQVTVELDYGLTYSPGDAVSHVDGFRVVVLNGRRFLGEKRKVRITSVTRTGAVAVLV